MISLSDAQLIKFLENHILEISRDYDEEGNVCFRVWLNGSTDPSFKHAKLRQALTYAYLAFVGKALTP